MWSVLGRWRGRYVVGTGSVTWSVCGRYWVGDVVGMWSVLGRWRGRYVVGTGSVTWSGCWSVPGRHVVSNAVNMWSVCSGYIVGVWSVCTRQVVDNTTVARARPARHRDVTSIGQRSLPWTYNSVKVEIKFLLECKFHFPSAQLMLRQMHLTNVSESIEAKYWVSWLTFDASKLPWIRHFVQ